MFHLSTLPEAVFTDNLACYLSSILTTIVGRAQRKHKIDKSGMLVSELVICIYCPTSDNIYSTNTFTHSLFVLMNTLCVPGYIISYHLYGKLEKMLSMSWGERHLCLKIF